MAVVEAAPNSTNVKVVVRSPLELVCSWVSGLFARDWPNLAEGCTGISAVF